MKVIVKVPRWLRGGKRFSYLRTKDGMQCCLGFAARQSGVRAKDILLTMMPDNLGGRDWEACSWMLPFAGEAVAINDNCRISDTERKSHLRALFRQHGHQIVFRP